MPKENVDEGLKGAEAVAFREYQPQTGLCRFRDGQLVCGINPKTCHLDLYVEKEADIPWTFPAH